MFRPLIIILVASSALLFSCKSSNNASDHWVEVFQNAWMNQDYTTGVVALNHLIISDSANRPAYYDSLAFYYIKKLRNYNAGKSIVKKGLLLSPDNYNLLEYNSIFLSADGKIDESRKMLQNAYKLSGLKKHLYMYATTFASEKNLEEYTKIVNGFLYDPNTKPEMVEVTVDETTSQQVDIKALCYLDKAKIAATPQLMSKYLDSALRIAPDYQEAMYYLQKLKSGK